MMNIALISDHASPLASPGSIDCGGQNVYVAHLACQLAALGCRVDIFTRRDSLGTAAGSPLARQDTRHSCAGRPASFVQQGEHAAVYGRVRPLHDCACAPSRMAAMTSSMPISSCQAWLRSSSNALGIPYVITFHALGKVRRLAQGRADGFPQERIEIEQPDARRRPCHCRVPAGPARHGAAVWRRRAERIEIVPCGFDPQDNCGPYAMAGAQKLGLDPANSWCCNWAAWCRAKASTP
jgi:D-inositol-3-phosphate glycosyltransferase